MVPYDFYKTLTMGAPKTELENTETKMHEILQDRHLDDSTKNILYNQELMNYLKQRKDIEERPLKVMNVRRPIRPYTLKAPKLHAAYPIVEETEDFDESPPTTPPTTPPPGPTFGQQSPPRHRSTSSGRRDRSPRDRHLSSSPSDDERERTRREKLRENIERKLNETAEDIYEIVKDRIDDFHITPNGMIMNAQTRRAFNKSKPGDALLAIKKFLGADTDAISGYSAFESRLKADPDISARLTRALTQLQAMSRGHRQRGTGILKVACNKSGRVSYYKCQKWPKCN